MTRILVADDDDGSRALLRKYLQRHGFDVLEAADGAETLALARDAHLALLDVVMPVVDGWHVVEALRRERPGMPIVMVTGKASLLDQIRGLESGADDYVTKPYDLDALHARIRALMRRTGVTDAIELGDLRIVARERLVYVGGRPVQLSRVEFDILTTLASHPGRVFSRAELIDRVWGSDYVGSDRVVDVRIVALRKKIGDHVASRRLIVSVRGVGYRIDRRSSHGPAVRGLPIEP
jgi:two-component system, OmpR family, alkaline phosphatase synthesis response regulator PhoP